MFFKLILFSVAVNLVHVTACCPSIVSRDEWGGYAPIRDLRFPGPVDIVVIQHTDTPKCTRNSTCKAMIQGIEDYHVDTLYYNSIGMNFLIGGNGKVYEGAGWEQIGTHTAGYNHRSISISFIGNYEQCPIVVTFKEWRGSEQAYDQKLHLPIKWVIIQHTVSETCYSDETCESIVQQMDNHFMNDQERHIVYNFLIGGNGKVYEGAGWKYVGSHSLKYNSLSVGISFIGNYNIDEPTEEQLKVAQNLIRCGVSGGHLVSDYHLVGHRQVVRTISPGDNLYREIQSWPNFLASKDPYDLFLPFNPKTINRV